MPRGPPGPAERGRARSLQKDATLTSTEKVYIVGVGEDGLAGLSDRARRLVEAAELLIGEANTLALVPPSGQERLRVGLNLDEIIRRIESRPQSRAVVLTVGDPLFYGVARYLCDRLGKDRFEVVPHVSSMQMAFARVKESWEEAFLTNLASHGIQQVLERIRGAEKVGLFTSDESPPAAVARLCSWTGASTISRPMSARTSARPTSGSRRANWPRWPATSSRPLNVMILVRKPNIPDRPREPIGRRLFGNPDDAVPAIEAQAGPAHAGRDCGRWRWRSWTWARRAYVWDIGAGSGSVAIEAAQIAAGGKVYAIEMDAEDHQLIVENARRFEREESGAGAGPRPGGLGALARPGRHFHRRQRAADQPAGRRGLRAAAARRPAGGDHGQHRQRGRGRTSFCRPVRPT